MLRFWIWPPRRTVALPGITHSITHFKTHHPKANPTRWVTVMIGKSKNFLCRSYFLELHGFLKIRSRASPRERSTNGDQPWEVSWRSERRAHQM